MFFDTVQSEAVGYRQVHRNMSNIRDAVFVGSRKCEYGSDWAICLEMDTLHLSILNLIMKFRLAREPSKIQILT